MDVEGADERFSMLRYGDCSWREADWGHHLGRRPGYPLAIAERLAERGVSMSFSDVYVDSLDDLPQQRTQLTRFVRLDAPPDLIVLQMSSAYSVRAILPARYGRWNDLRMQLAWRTGRLAIPVYAILHPLLRTFGKRPSVYPGAERLETFIELVQAEWPDVPFVYLSPASRPRDGWLDRAENARVWEELAAHARAMGVDVVDTRDAIDALLADRSAGRVRALNGYDLRRPGHEVVADHLMPLVERRLAARSRSAVRAPAR